MDSPDPDDYIPTFYIGHHDSDRTRVTPELLRQAQDCNYDMLTTPITTPHFHTRVLKLLSEHLIEVGKHPKKDLPVPTIPSLSPVDTPLAPNEIVSQLLAVVSPWIDLSSPDPVIYKISRQVLELEVAYASFCGIGNIILPAPKLHHGKVHGDGITQFAFAVQEALNIGQFLQICVSIPMIDDPEDEEDDDHISLAARARGRYLGLPDHGYDSISVAESIQAEDSNVGSSPYKKAAKFDFFGTWDCWNVIRTVCKYNSRLFVALIVPPRLPPPSVQSRWHSEPLRILFIDETVFDSRTGHPDFTEYHQALLTRYMRIRQPPWLLLTNVGPIPDSVVPETAFSVSSESMTPDIAADPQSPTPVETSQLLQRSSQKGKDPLRHLNCLRRLQRRQPPRTIIEKFGAGYQDFLQAPLQPLTDNLESVTYEVFEKDPVKYDQYFQAIEKALRDWRKDKKRASGPDERIVVAVVGAGRGPLVTRALQASDSSHIPIEVWVVEKNQNAFVQLQRHNEETWDNRVNLVKSDMRSWKGPIRESFAPTAQPSGYTGQWSPQHTEHDASNSNIYNNQTPKHSPNKKPPQSQSQHPIDIVISELLGSFADNELSPECLDGILPLLNPTHGISIPASYTAYLTPISAPKLHADIFARTATDPTAPNTPYVVMLHAIDYLSTKSRASGTESIPTIVPNVQKAWSFSHGPSSALPPESINRHNERHARLSFGLRDRAVCHGLAGYFEAVLYPGIELSTNPLTMEEKSPLMMSWFPIFFPLKTPIYAPDASTLTVSIFRATDNRKVWYEWVVEAWSNLMVGGSNQGGSLRKVKLGVSEVGSSKSAGCLM